MYRNEDRITREDFPRDEMLLDVCLEEVLSGQTPPDLTARILAAMENSQSTTGEVVAPPVTPPPVATPVAPHATPRVNRSHRSRPTRRPTASRQWTGIAVAASLLVVGVGVVIAALQLGGPDATPVAVDDVLPPVEVTPDREAQNSPSIKRDQPAGSPFNETLFGAKFPSVPEESTVPWALPYAVQRKADDEVVQFVNAQVDGQAATTTIDDDAWCRRVFQQLLGRSPTSDELVDFATSKSVAKREQLVDRLLTADAYRDEYATHWAEVWSAELIGSEATDDELASREGLRKYLNDAFRAGKGQDELTTELIAATGSNRPGTPQFNGATNFVLAGAHGDKAELAATVGRVFLGHQGQCAQCHDSMGHDGNGTDGLSQQQFWQLAAFFQQAKPVEDKTTGAVRLVNSDFVGPTGDVGDAELFYETPDKQRQIAYPVFVDGTPISADGRVNVVDRRLELAKLIVSSEDFSAAMVKQYWQQLLGLAPGDAVDVLAQQRLVEGLAEQFAAHDFDQRQLMRWIVLSDANLRPELRDTDSPRGGPLYENVAMALHDVSRQGRPIGMNDRLMYARINATPKPGVDSPAIIDPEPRNIPVRKTSANEFVQRMIASDMATSDKIEHLFLHMLARRPSRDEMSAARKLLASHDGNVAATLDDLWWAITNSAEM